MSGLSLPSRAGATPLFLLSGPTASGKTELAHALADRHGLRLLSVDSMMVYRDMDIGTAKPTPAEIKTYAYAGLNLVDPGTRFSTGDWLRCVRRQLDDRPTLAVGGTGLYFRALTQGLTPDAGAEKDKKPDAEADVAALQAKIRCLDPGALSRIADPENPRRLARALTWLQAGKPLPQHWADLDPVPLPVLRLPVPWLDERIRTRAAAMFAAGLLEEAARLRGHYGALPGTAAQAIGYQEAFAVLEGTLTPEAAAGAVARRTRKYAKRQRTWFRNQMAARWVDRAPESDLEGLLRGIEDIWRATGPFWFQRETTNDG